jgi:hypothetical protein
MRNSEKDRAKRNQRKQKKEIKALMLSCKHERRTFIVTPDVIAHLSECKHPNRSASGSENECRLVCRDCGQIIVMAGVGVFGSSLDPSAKRNEAHKRHG